MNAPALSSPLSLPVNRNAVIASVVVALHVLLLWALQSGLLMRAAEMMVPAIILSEIVNPPTAKAEPVPPAPPTPPVPVKKAVARAPAPILPTPQLMAVADTSPAPNAATTVAAPQPPAAPAAVAAAPAAPAAVQLPSSDADYLQNPKPAYPNRSWKLGEQGQVIHSVLIGVDGRPVSAKLVKSSGFERLDKAAYDAIMKWRFTPGKRNGVPEAMSFNVPINFVLE
ncbi:energy transducer TonB [Polaromonas sp.]|uniref:energy transducer TonB n=1 Tax=Polaromonas sp. TaxID=1869339 RepID=UPI002FCBE2F0